MHLQHLNQCPQKTIKGKFTQFKLPLKIVTGCKVCVESCPVTDKKNPKHKALDMHPQVPLREQEKINWDFLPFDSREDRSTNTIYKYSATANSKPLFEFSGACAGCGETPYLKIVSQMFGDRTIIANATGCSSIYGGNLPTTPWAKNHDGRGPAWNNSLFEDNENSDLECV
jgi:pyruvate-ferredoxin/flavodoxin oxidoreductase